MNEKETKMVIGWQNFEKTGKISDYLEYKHSQAKNVTEANTNANKDHGTGNQAT
ncbi:MAG: hypothetical protein RR497_03215 [Oscillospiraceae bacterium]